MSTSGILYAKDATRHRQHHQSIAPQKALSVHTLGHEDVDMHCMSAWVDWMKASCMIHLGPAVVQAPDSLSEASSAQALDHIYDIII